MSEFEIIYRMQLLDSSIHELEERERELPLKIEVEEGERQLENLRSLLDGKKKDLEEVKARQRKLEAEIESLSAKITAEEDKLYGGKITNPKELRGIQAEVQALKKKRDGEETLLLEEMDRAEELESHIREVKSQMEAEEKDLREKRSRLEEELSQMAEERAQAQGEKEELEQKVSQELLELYRELLKSKHGLAVVKVSEEGACQGCRVALPAQDYDRFLRSDGLFRCPNCRRILVK